MPPPNAWSKMALWLRYWLLSDNYRSVKADLYNIEETMRDHVDQKDLHLVCSQIQDTNMKQTCFHHCLFTAYV